MFFVTLDVQYPERNKDGGMTDRKNPSKISFLKRTRNLIFTAELLKVVLFLVLLLRSLPAGSENVNDSVVALPCCPSKLDSTRVSAPRSFDVCRSNSTLRRSAVRRLDREVILSHVADSSPNEVETCRIGDTFPPWKSVILARFLFRAERSCGIAR